MRLIRDGVFPPSLRSHHVTSTAQRLADVVRALMAMLQACEAVIKSWHPMLPQLLGLISEFIGLAQVSQRQNIKFVLLNLVSQSRFGKLSYQLPKRPTGVRPEWSWGIKNVYGWLEDGISLVEDGWAEVELCPLKMIAEQRTAKEIVAAPEPESSPPTLTALHGPPGPAPP